MVSPGKKTPAPSSVAAVPTLLLLLCLTTTTMASINVFPEGVRAKLPFKCHAPPLPAKANTNSNPAKAAASSGALLKMRNVEAGVADGGISPFSLTISAYPSRSEVSVALSWNGGVLPHDDPQHQGYLVTFRANGRGYSFVRCSCFLVPKETTAMTVSTDSRNSRSHFQKWINRCLSPSWFNIPIQKQVEVTSLGVPRRTAILNFTIPSCSEMECRPSVCRDFCRPNPVHSLQLAQLNNTAVNVSWGHTPRDNSALPPISTFGVRYQRILPTPGQETTFSIGSDTHSVIISPLEPHQIYRVSVIAVSGKRSSNMKGKVIELKDVLNRQNETRTRDEKDNNEHHALPPDVDHIVTSPTGLPHSMAASGSRGQNVS